MNGEMIRERRQILGLSLRAFADLAKMSPAYLSQIETGKVQPGKRTLAKIQKIIDMDTNTINHYLFNNVYEEMPTCGDIVSELLRVLNETQNDERAIAALLSFLRAIENYYSSSPTNNAEIIGIMVDTYYQYFQKNKARA